MSRINLSKFHTPEELFIYVRSNLEGKTLREVAESIEGSDSVERLRSKAGVGHFIEEEYFGLKKNSTAAADIAHLGVEIKTSALRYGKDGLLRVKEPLSLNIINYREEVNNDDIKESSLYRKNRFILFVWYIHDDGPRSAYRIPYVFLWNMDDAIDELNPDYQLIIEKIRAGKAHQIHQSEHAWLTLCPKHGGTFKDPLDRKSKTVQPCSDAPAEIRAFRLKNCYMSRVIYRYLTEHAPKRLAEFAPPRLPRQYKERMGLA
jgi:DNA mismatch repair protein MutH